MVGGGGKEGDAVVDERVTVIRVSLPVKGRLTQELSMMLLAINSLTRAVDLLVREDQSICVIALEQVRVVGLLTDGLGQLSSWLLVLGSWSVWQIHENNG